MKKKILLSFVFLIGLFLITGCGSNKNELKCSGKYVLSYDALYSTMNSIDENGEEVTEYGVSFGYDEGYGKGEYTFTFNDDNTKIIGISGKETYSESISSEFTNEQLEEYNDAAEGAKYYRDRNGHVVIDFQTNPDSIMIKALNSNISSKNQLKEVLEEYTTLSCK